MDNDDLERDRDGTRYFDKRAPMSKKEIWSQGQQGCGCGMADCSELIGTEAHHSLV